MTKYAVDLDGTLADTVGATLELYNERYGTAYRNEDIRQWRFWNFFPELQTLPESKRRDTILRLMDEAWLTGRVRPLPGATQFMARMRERTPVDILTGRSEKTPTETIERWLREHGIVYDQIVRVKGSGVAKVLQPYDVYVDDDPNVAEEIATRWPDKRIFLIDQPWNQHVPESERVTRAALNTIPTPGTKQTRLFRRPTNPVVHVRQYRRRR